MRDQARDQVGLARTTPADDAEDSWGLHGGPYIVRRHGCQVARGRRRDRRLPFGPLRRREGGGTIPWRAAAAARGAAPGVGGGEGGGRCASGDSSRSPGEIRWLHGAARCTRGSRWPAVRGEGRPCL